MKRTLLALFILLMTQACTRSYHVFCTKYSVSFSCEVSQSPFNSINTWGYFLSVRPTATKNGYRVKLPNGSEQEFPYTEVQNRVFQFGLAGIIIGRPYFGDGEVYAYDLGCPQCDKPSTRLSISTDGIATCAKCKSQYDLNNSGVAQTNDSRPLYRYRTTLNGNLLMIHN
ncbi:MAG: hypothetical protein IKY84_02700 [Bacteroidaceae bacterium]|nr:hypothetical protein [Bacteroidaceae bacterium]